MVKVTNLRCYLSFSLFRPWMTCGTDLQPFPPAKTVEKTAFTKPLKTRKKSQTTLKRIVSKQKEEKTTFAISHVQSKREK